MTTNSNLVTEVKKEVHGEFVYVLLDSWVMAKRSILHIVRSLDQIMGVAMFPIMFMFLNRYVLGGAIDTGDVSYANYLFAGIFVQTLAFGANYTTINLAVDLQQGIIDRLRSLPMHTSALLVGHIVADLVRNIVSGIVVILAGFLVGFRPTAGIMEWLYVFGLAIIFSLAISWLSAILGLFVKSLEAAQWVGFVLIFPLTFISSAFVPTDTMPRILQIFAENQPLTQVMNAMRGWLVGTPLGNSPLIALVWCVGIIVLSVPLASWLFERRGK
jgi:ABC-2 type transport system permease protein